MSVKNPLGEIISDEQFEQLMNEGLLNPMRVRDRTIKARYDEMRIGKPLSSDKCIEKIRDEEYPYLTFETIRKIVMCRWKKRN